MVSYQPNGIYLDLGRHSVSRETKVHPSEIVSSKQQIPVSYSSYPYGKSSPTIIGDLAFMKSGGNRLEEFAKSDFDRYGLATHWEDRADRFSGWIANSTKNPPAKNDIIPTYYDITGNRIGGISYITGIKPLRMWFPHENDTKTLTYTTPRIVEDTDINRIGNRASQLENFRQKIRTNVLFNDANQFHYEIARWAEFLESKGIKPKEHPFLGLGIERSNDFTAAYYPKQHYLVANFDFNSIARDLIKKYGLTEGEAVEAAERNIILHEIAHAYGIKGGRRGEKLQGELAAEFYSQLAEDSGGKWSRIYRALAQYRKDYAEDFSLTNWLIREATKGQEFEYSDLTYHKFWHEGVALGYKGKQLDAYIKSRMKDTYKDFFDDEPAQKPEGLESIIEKEAGVSEEKSAHDAGTNEKVVYMTRRANNETKKEESEGKAEIVYGRFGKEKYEGKKSSGEKSEKPIDSKTTETRKANADEAPAEESTAEAA